MLRHKTGPKPGKKSLPAMCFINKVDWIVNKVLATDHSMFKINKYNKKYMYITFSYRKF